MPNRLSLLGFFTVAALTPALVQAQPVPKGEVTKYTFDQSKIFPGTVRDYWIYVPQQYDPAKPACVHVNQDGIQFNAPAVFDQLIAKQEMPVTIGVFITPGRVKATSDKALDRFNRSYEYDGLGDNYVRFLLEELLPEVEKKKASNGRAIKLSKDGNDRSIAGSSSGAVCAFTAAWERPDAFRRVFSAIGTYVGLRGANNYATLIRKYEPKPLKIFLQDGSKDLNIYGGDWWMANQEMERSLAFAGYEVKHSWDNGGHSNAEGTKVFPEAMRWLWKDWPAPVKTGKGSPQLRDILISGEEWKLVSEGYKSIEGTKAEPSKEPARKVWQSLTGLAANAKGELFFRDIYAPDAVSTQSPEFKCRICRIGLDGKTTLFLNDSTTTFHNAFGPDGRLYGSDLMQVVAYDSQGTSAVIVERKYDYLGSLIVRHDGGIYVTGDRVVRYVSPKRELKKVDEGASPSAVTLSPDQSLLYVADGKSNWVYSYQIQPDGSLAHKQRFYNLHSIETEDGQITDAKSMCVDRNGRLYVATRLGIQICDQAGRVNCIVPTPGPATSICFGGADFDVLFAICSDKVYARKLKVRGANAFEAPIKPAVPQL